MTPQGMAKELVDKMYMSDVGFGMTIKTSKQCALIAVDFILARDKQWMEKLRQEKPDEWAETDYKKSILLFEEVKTEIEKL